MMMVDDDDGARRFLSVQTLLCFDECIFFFFIFLYFFFYFVVVVRSCSFLWFLCFVLFFVFGNFVPPSNRYVLKLLAKGALALCEGDAPEIVDGVRVWVSGPDSGGYGAAGTGTAVSFRTAAYYVVLNQIAEQQLDADGAGSDEEDSYDFDDSESDDDHDGASGDEGGGGVGHGEGFLLSDVAMMGGMGALYGDEESDDEDDESELGDGLVEDNEDDKADNPGASELLDFSSTVAGIIQSVGPRPELRTAMGMLPAHRQERVRKFLTGGGAGRK